ncbi:hypothetical protein RAA17_16620 [Komagataeibacter rhaeticus]|nr:hypothetical protein [Komagataeibacter rhaeticus]
MMEAMQLDLCDYITGLPRQSAPEPQVNLLDLLPRRPKAWERMVAHIPAAEVRLLICLMWTGVVVEQLRQGLRADMLLRSGKIDCCNMPDDCPWPEPCRLVILTAAQAVRIHNQWCLEITASEQTRFIFRFADRQYADRARTSRLLAMLEKGQS